jgi:hypothetical protein
MFSVLMILLVRRATIPGITKVCLTLPDIRSGKDSLFTRLNRISQDRKNIKLFLSLQTGHVKIIGYQFGAKFKLVFCAKYDRGLDLGFWK